MQAYRDEPEPRPSAWARLATGAWPGRPARWRDVPRRLQPAGTTVVRLTAASVIAYLLTLLVTDGAVDLTGALTALLVVQTSAYATLKMGVVRVGSVLAGVLVATALSTWIGLTWWSLGAAIAASLVLAKVLRLGPQALETPISAMLILGMTNPDVGAETRVVTTLLGAGVGIAFNLLYPPALPVRSASQALLRVATATAAPLDTAGTALRAGPISPPQVASWLSQTRSASRRVADAADVITLLKDSRRLNPRALGVVDVEPVLATGLDTLERCLLATRALFAVLGSELPHTVPAAVVDADPEPDPYGPFDVGEEADPYGEELRAAFAVVLHDVADCVRAFGALVVAETGEDDDDPEAALATSLEVLRETRAILVELLMVDVQESQGAWLLRGSILAAVEQVLTHLDLPTRTRLHARWQDAQAARPMAQLPPLLEGVLPHPERPLLPRGLQPRRRRPRRGS